MPDINLCDYYKALQAQPTTNVVGEVHCPSGTTLGLQELAAEKGKQNNLFVKIVTRNRPGIANRICANNL